MKLAWGERRKKGMPVSAVSCHQNPAPSHLTNWIGTFTGIESKTPHIARYINNAVGNPCHRVQQTIAVTHCYKMARNRQALVALCVLLLGLVGVLLYRIQVLSSQMSQQPRTYSRFSAFFNLVNPGKK